MIGEADLSEQKIRDLEVKILNQELVLTDPGEKMWILNKMAELEDRIGGGFQEIEEQLSKTNKLVEQTAVDMIMAQSKIDKIGD